MRIEIRSGGQSGVDRAALCVARDLGLRCAGWCPRGGWAEDRTIPPGLIAEFPDLTTTPSSDPRQRTAWNVRDSDATLILLPGVAIERSPGTEFTRLCAELLFEKPCRVADMQDDGSIEDVRAWLQVQGDARSTARFVLNVAGPRESEAAGVFDQAKRYLMHLLELWRSRQP